MISVDNQNTELSTCNFDDNGTEYFANYLIPLYNLDDGSGFDYWLEVSILGGYRIWQYGRELKCTGTVPFGVFNKRMFIYDNYLIVSRDYAIDVPHLYQTCKEGNTIDTVQIKNIDKLKALTKTQLKNCFVSFF